MQELPREAGSQVYLAGRLYLSEWGSISPLKDLDWRECLTNPHSEHIALRAM